MSEESDFASSALPQQASLASLPRLKSQALQAFNVNLSTDTMARQTFGPAIYKGFGFMFGKFFNTKSVDEFAEWVVEEVKRTLPPTFDPSLKNVSGKVERLDKRITERTTSFTQSSKLNIYQKARLASRVQEGMSAFGYPKTFVKTFSMDIVKRVMAASRVR